MLKINCSHEYLKPEIKYLIWKDTIYRGDLSKCKHCYKYSFKGRTYTKDEARIKTAMQKYNLGQIELYFMPQITNAYLNGEYWDIENF